MKWSFFVWFCNARIKLLTNYLYFEALLSMRCVACPLCKHSCSVNWNRKTRVQKNTHNIEFLFIIRFHSWWDYPFFFFSNDSNSHFLSNYNFHSSTGYGQQDTRYQGYSQDYSQTYGAPAVDYTAPPPDYTQQQQYDDRSYSGYGE